jgi:DNA polymerase III sliding clamp (beta) subunit (PCNA family)
MHIHTYTGGRTLAQCDIDHHSLIHVLVPANSLPEAEEEEEEEEDISTKIHFLENVLERAELAESRQKLKKNLRVFYMVYSK